MGNCGSNPKTDEGPVPVAQPVTKEIKTEETTHVIDDKSLDTLLNENVEEAQKTKEVKTEVDEIKAETKTDEIKVQEENPKKEEAKKTEA
ncbi:PREDICTED: probable serine/threonine-protein kinase kinX isoform X2 [Lupinus angustifolius]|uniref:probable serine/threonine-protein kinase kinX isoform X2 n=1 Tax=Lupinus angustifolius TaxID=3871 RepID=UPI00092F33C0|nr:PREDICTED: probable serine/threonine-protein kinase kinX isoform X2 [Lupinus angustifolius]